MVVPLMAMFFARDDQCRSKLTINPDRSQGSAGRVRLSAWLAMLFAVNSLIQFSEGNVFNGQTASTQVYGVYAPDRREALIVHATLTAGMSLLPPPVRLPGLQPDTRYCVEQVPLPWTHPESGVLLHLRAV
jgi:hypothetical protein